MGKIVAIGGGEIGQNETLEIDKYIIALVNKDITKILFIPTASNDAQEYIDCVDKYFTSLNCVVDSLCLINENLTQQEIKDKILNTDIIYVGGGNTRQMMNIWKKNNVDTYLKLAYDKGIVLSGLSAGSICWFKWGHSDSDTYENGFECGFSKVAGLGFLNFAHCPHYNESGRDSFDKMIAGENISGIALENCTALVEINGEFSILKSDDTYNAYIMTNNYNNLIKCELSSGIISIHI